MIQCPSRIRQGVSILYLQLYSSLEFHLLRWHSESHDPRFCEVRNESGWSMVQATRRMLATQCSTVNKLLQVGPITCVLPESFFINVVGCIMPCLRFRNVHPNLHRTNISIKSLPAILSPFPCQSFLLRYLSLPRLSRWSSSHASTSYTAAHRTAK